MLVSADIRTLLCHGTGAPCKVSKIKQQEMTEAFLRGHQTKPPIAVCRLNKRYHVTVARVADVARVKKNVAIYPQTTELNASLACRKKTRF